MTALQAFCKHHSLLDTIERAGVRADTLYASQYTISIGNLLESLGGQSGIVLSRS